MFDLIIKNGTILDGSGQQGFISDIGIEKGKITRICSNLSGAKHFIDASGLTVTPGFIDSHSHADKKILFYPEQREKLQQGITTSIGGQCGGSVAPSHRDTQTVFGNSADICATMGCFIDLLQDKKMGSNLVPFIGHGTVRREIMGDSNKAPDAQQLNSMLGILEEAFLAGAGGLSFGLFYAPGCYATTEEAIECARVAAKYGRPVSAHIRNESESLVEAVEEFITIIRKSGARGILSHHKAIRKNNWGKVKQTCAMLEQAVTEGVDIYCDIYPFCASSTTLSQAFVPNAWRADGTDALLNCIADQALYENNKADFISRCGSVLDWILVNSCPAFPEYEGLTLDKIAKIHGKDHFDTAMDIIVQNRDKANACFFTISEDDLKHVLAWDRTMICTDSGMAAINKKVHPRMTASFPRAIGRYVREQGVLCLPEMIKRMTSLPAYVYGLRNKGLLQEGYDADICIFDSQKIHNPSDFVNCREVTVGLHYVLVNGEIVAENGIFNGKMQGQLLISK